MAWAPPARSVMAPIIGQAGAAREGARGVAERRCLLPSPGMATEVADAEIARRQAERLHLPFHPLDVLVDDPALWSETPLELLVRFACVPIGREGGRIVMAFGGLEDYARADEAEFH